MKSLTKLSQHGHWLLRGAIASVFIYHGLGKFQNLALGNGCSRGSLRNKEK